MQGTQRFRTTVVLALALLLLPACSSGAEADPEGWAAALEEVPGVTSAEADFGRYGAGYQSDVVVRTDTNDYAELEKILRESVTVFVEVTADMDTFSVHFKVGNADGTGVLYPETIGWDSGPIGFLREDVAAESGG
jgi:hypothetical protein